MRSFFTPQSALALLIGVGGGSLWSSTALAEDALPVPPVYEQQAPAAQSTTTVTTTTQTAPAAPAVPAVPAVPAPPAAVPAPPALPPPPVLGAQRPMYYNGPVWVIPAPGVSQAPAALPPPPLYVPPRSLIRTASCCTDAARYVPPAHGPLFGIGLRFTAQGINQQVFGQDLNMLGGGLVLRFRNRGHWGFETAFDVLQANINSGAFVRTSYPVSGALMLYLFQNRPDSHFNIYGVAGIGLSPDSITLYDQSPQQRNQQFLEIQGQAGGGIELRFHRLALSADVRVIGSALDDSSPDGAYYKGVDGGPIPGSSVGYKANLGAMLWF